MWHPVHAAANMQGLCRPSWNPTISVKSNQCNRKSQIKFVKHPALFLVIPMMKKRPILKEKKHWQGLSNEGVQSGQGHGVMMNKSYFQIMTQKHEFLSMTPWLIPLGTPFFSKPLQCSFQNRSFFYCSYNPKKFWMSKNIYQSFIN